MGSWQARRDPGPFGADSGAAFDQRRRMGGEHVRSWPPLSSRAGRRSWRLAPKREVAVRIRGRPPVGSRSRDARRTCRLPLLQSPLSRQRPQTPILPRASHLFDLPIAEREDKTWASANAFRSAKSDTGGRRRKPGVWFLSVWRGTRMYDRRHGRTGSESPPVRLRWGASAYQPEGRSLQPEQGTMQAHSRAYLS